MNKSKKKISAGPRASELELPPEFDHDVLDAADVTFEYGPIIQFGPHRYERRALSGVRCR